MKRQRVTVEMPLLPSERSGQAARWETKKVLAIIAKRKKKAARKAKEKKENKAFELSVEKLAELKAMTYKKYLRSKYWKKIRLIILKKYKYTCQKCGSNKTLEVHHIEYVPRGKEHKNLSILTLLCGSCHMENHGIDTSVYQPWGGRVGHDERLPLQV